MEKIKKNFTLALALSVMLVACSSDESVGSVNGRDISKEAFSAYLQMKRIPQQNEQRVAAALDEYLQREALAEAIQDTEKLDSLALAAELNEFKKQMLISRYFETYLNEKVGDEAVRNYYNGNPDEFEHEQAKVAHILIRVGSKASKKERQALLTKSQEVYSKLSSGLDFSSLARDYSEDTVSAKQGGELGWLRRGAIDPVLSEKAFTLSKGDFSEPFSTPFGFHIVKLLDGPQVIKAPFEKVSGDIRYRLRKSAKDAEYTRLLKEGEVEK